MGKKQYGNYKEALMATNVSYRSSNVNNQMNGRQMGMKANSMNEEYLRGTGNGYRVRGNKKDIILM